MPRFKKKYAKSLPKLYPMYLLTTARTLTAHSTGNHIIETVVHCQKEESNETNLFLRHVTRWALASAYEATSFIAILTFSKVSLPLMYLRDNRIHNSHPVTITYGWIWMQEKDKVDWELTMRANQAPRMRYTNEVQVLFPSSQQYKKAQVQATTTTLMKKKSS